MPDTLVEFCGLHLMFGAIIFFGFWGGKVLYDYGAQIVQTGIAPHNRWMNRTYHPSPVKIVPKYVGCVTIISGVIGFVFGIVFSVALALIDVAILANYILWN